MATAPVEFPIHGTTAPGFEPIRDVFERNFTADIEVGASFAAVVDGETVVDLWGRIPGSRLYPALARGHAGQCLFDHQGHRFRSAGHRRRGRSA